MTKTPTPRLSRPATCTRLSGPATCVLLALATGWPTLCAAQAVLPAGAQVVHGKARITTQGAQMTVATGRNTAIDWRSFSIGAQAAVRFDQPDAASQVLNRVLGRDPSQILGRLSSNGEVWLLNPHGVLFGREARVDVGGLVASGLHIGLADWAAGRRVVAARPGAGAAEVGNAGTLRAASGGRILLVGAGAVHNSGALDAPGGHIGLRSTERMDLADSHHPDIAVRVQTAADGQVLNRGSITAAAGGIDLQAAMVNQQGVLRADGITTGAGGRVLLQASGALHLAAGSVTSATGAEGGRIDLVGGTQTVQGQLDVSGLAGTGGRLTLAAPRIALMDGAALRADGVAGGGSMRIGLAGPATEPAAQAVFVGPGASLSADASQRGDGGRIHLWSDGATRAYGQFSARGGALGGDGGLVDTSGGGGVDARPAQVDMRAPHGRAGQWLLDPLDIQIVPGAGSRDMATDTNQVFSPLAPGAEVGIDTISAALRTANVTVSTGLTGSVGTEAGTISMRGVRLAPDLGTGGGERTLTLQAASGINLANTNIFPAGGLVNLDLQAGDGITLQDSNLLLSGNLTLRAARFTSERSVSSAVRIDLRADQVTLRARAADANNQPLPVLHARADGVAMQLRGLAGNIASFSSVGGAGVLAVDAGGRWLLYANDPASTTLGGLLYDFKHYGATAPVAPAQATGNGLLYATQPVLGITAAGLPLDKVYDRSTTITLDRGQLDSIQLTGLLGNDQPVGMAGVVGSLAYASRNAAVGVPITATLADGLPTILDQDSTVYGYGFSGQGLAGTISAAPVRVLAATVADKVYDGSSAARVSAWQLGGVLAGDTVAVAAGTASFVDSRAGVAKAVQAQAGALGGADAANYRISQASADTTATITPATLAYRAQPLTVVAGAPWPPLTGSVTGFVNGETLASSTTGTQRYGTAATAASPPGAYAVQGSGLAAANYALVQDPANASALRLLPQGSDDGLPRVRPPQWWPSPAGPQASAQVVAVPPPTSAGFAPLEVNRLAPWQFGTAVRARTLAMDHAFRKGIAMLNADPMLARLPDCADLAGALQGDCVITPPLKSQLTTLWGQSPGWAEALATLDPDALFAQLFWTRPPEPDVSGPLLLILPGDGSLVQHVSLAPGLGGGMPILAPTLMLLSQGGGAATPGMPTPDAVVIAGAPTGGGGSGSPPPASLAAATQAVPDASGTGPGAAATPGLAAAGSPTTAGTTAAGGPAAPVCTTTQQRRSGECQRQAELDALRDALQLCAQMLREQQSACLFNQRVKFHLQQRQRDAGLLTVALQSSEAKRATLPDIRRKWALVIGVEQYPRVALGGQPVRMPNAGHDARAMARELRTGFGYITSELVNPSRAQVVQRLNMLAAVAQPHDSLLVFFSGYGFSVAQGDDAIWALADADPQDGRTMLSHADLARLLELIDARQVALISDSALAGRLRLKAVDYDPKAAPDAAGLLERRATVALTSGGNLPLASTSGQGLSDFTAQLLGVLRRVSTWHVGGRVFREVQTPLIRAGRPFVPLYGAASQTLHQPRADYVFERRELERDSVVKP